MSVALFAAHIVPVCPGVPDRNRGKCIVDDTGEVLADVATWDKCDLHQDASWKPDRINEISIGMVAIGVLMHVCLRAYGGRFPGGARSKERLDSLSWYLPLAWWRCHVRWLRATPAGEFALSLASLSMRRESRW